MAVKAKAQITIFYVNEVEAVYRYYLLQSSTLAKPSAPTAYPPGGSWVVTEPTYTEGSTTSLYYVDCTVLSDGTWSYSPVSLSSSYEAAKLAYNKAIAAIGRVTTAEQSIEAANGEILLRASKTELDTAVSSINGNIGDIQSSLDETSTNLSDLQNEYENTYQIVTQNSTKISELLQTAEGWTMDFTTLNTTVTELNGRLTSETNERYEYIRFIDGDIYLGKKPEAGVDDLQLIISNEKMSFMLNGEEVAYFSNDSLYVTTIRVLKALRFGNFEFAERSNGNMGLRWVGVS